MLKLLLQINLLTITTVSIYLVRRVATKKKMPWHLSIVFLVELILSSSPLERRREAKPKNDKILEGKENSCKEENMNNELLKKLFQTSNEIFWYLGGASEKDHRLNPSFTNRFFIHVCLT